MPFSAAALADCAITMLDFNAAIPKVQPSVRREGFATTPDVTWQDVGALPQVILLMLLGVLQAPQPPAPGASICTMTTWSICADHCMQLAIIVQQAGSGRSLSFLAHSRSVLNSGMQLHMLLNLAFRCMTTSWFCREAMALCVVASYDASDLHIAASPSEFNAASMSSAQLDEMIT